MDSTFDTPVTVERVGFLRTVGASVWAPFRLLSGPIASLFTRFGPSIFSFFIERIFPENI